MSVQACEGVWRQKCGRYVAVISCEPREGGQRWTDGVLYYADDGTVTFLEGGCAVDLVEYIGPIPQPDQTAKIDLLRTTLTEQTAEIDRLRAELEQSQGVRKSLAAEIERLQTELRGYAAESHRQLRALQESHNKVTATLQAEQRGEREGFRIAISMILEALK